MKFGDLAIYFQTLSEDILLDVPDIIAETATEYYKQTFTEKAFDGTTWPSAKPKNTGSLLVESGNLVNSIRPAVVEAHRVVISAGNDKVNYAQVHNQGFTGAATIPAHTRKTRKGEQKVKQHTRQMNLPKRQFMGKSNELATLLVERIEGYIQTTLKG